MSALASLLIVTLSLDAPVTGAPADSPHDLEVKAFASTLAVTKMASDRCADILIDWNLVRYLGKQAHYVKERDAPMLASEARALVGRLQNAISDAPNQRSWCDSVYRLYGPAGALIPDLMRRFPEP